jgi:phosphatidylinositol glycan class O
VEPAPEATSKRQGLVAILVVAVRTGLATSQYFGGLLLGSATSAALLRRYLMVWKVFTPRYMLGAIELTCADVAVLVWLLLGINRIVSRIGCSQCQRRG